MLPKALQPPPCSGGMQVPTWYSSVSLAVVREALVHSSLLGCPMREAELGAEGCLSGSPSLLGVQRFSTQHLCLLLGEAECPFHGNLVGSGMAGPGKLSRAALMALEGHQTRFSVNQECRKLLFWASCHGISSPGKWMKPWPAIAF